MQNLTIFTEKSKENLKPTTKNNISEVLNQKFFDLSTSSSSQYVTKPYQFFGIYIAKVLDDFKNLALYIKLAKEQDKNILDAALSYVKDYPNPRSKRQIFLWYLKGKLKKQKQASSVKPKVKPLNIFKYIPRKRKIVDRKNITFI